MKKSKLLLLVTVALLSVLVMGSSFTRAVSPEWNVGDIYLWGTLARSYAVENGVKTEILITSEVEYNITGINTLDLEFDAYRTTTSGRQFLNDRSYGADDFISSAFHLGSFVGVDYEWDYEHNRTVLTEFVVSLDPYYLLEPDWAKINKAFRDMLNGSEIIETVNDPYSSTVYNFTLQEVMDYLNVKINGKNSFASGWNSFTDSRTKWSFEFDLSGKVNMGQNNGTMILYTPFEKATIKLEIEYTKGGVLEKSLAYQYGKITIDGETSEGTEEAKIALGGLESVQANFATLAALGGLVLTATFFVLKRRRQK